MSCVICSHLWNCITHDGQSTWCRFREAALTWNIYIMEFGHSPDQFYFTLTWSTVGIAVNCLCKDRAFCPVQQRISSPQQMASSTDLMEGNSRAFPAWPNDPEAYEAGGGRKRGRGLGQNDVHCWSWAIKGSRSWRYKCSSPSEFGLTSHKIVTGAGEGERTVEHEVNTADTCFAWSFVSLNFFIQAFAVKLVWFIVFKPCLSKHDFKYMAGL